MVEKDDKSKEKILEMTIEELDLSVRSFQLPQAGGHQHSGRPRQQVRGRDDEGAATSAANRSRKSSASSHSLGFSLKQGRRVINKQSGGGAAAPAGRIWIGVNTHARNQEAREDDGPQAGDAQGNGHVPA
jgi:hypothetical protein